MENNKKIVRDDWCLVIGLGNPGKRYELTRHNLGFLSIDELAFRCRVNYSCYEFDSFFGFGSINGFNVILMKPLSYMNCSGFSVREIIKKYEIVFKNVIVLYDDVDLAFGRIKISERGDGGHKGVRSLIDALEIDLFTRLRMGIGRPSCGVSVSDYVLSEFYADECSFLGKFISQSLKALTTVLCFGVREAMNRFNGRLGLTLNDV